MIRWLAAFCAVVSPGLSGAPAYADGVRGIHIGESCGKAAVIEPALGSSLIETGEAVSFMHFSGSYSGQAADIVYLCDDDRLVEQVITIGADNRDHAFRL